MLSSTRVALEAKTAFAHEKEAIEFAKQDQPNMDPANPMGRPRSALYTTRSESCTMFSGATSGMKRAIKEPRRRGARWLQQA